MTKDFFQLIRIAGQRAIVRIGIGWMFALLTCNFSRITIGDPGATAIIITSLIGLHHFRSPLQVFWSNRSDRFALPGLRRTPYIVLSALVGSLVFLLLPELAVALVLAVVVLRGISPQDFQGMDRADMTAVLAFDAAS